MALAIAKAAACVGAAYLVNKVYRFYVAVTDQERCMREVRLMWLPRGFDDTDRSQLHDKMSLPREILLALRDEMVEQVWVYVLWLC